MPRPLLGASLAIALACLIPAVAAGARYATPVRADVTPSEWVATHPELTGAARADAAVRRASTHPAPGGGQVVRFQQYVDGIPVLGAQTVVQTDRRGDVRFAQGERLGGVTPALAPDIGPAAAAARARAVVAKHTGVSPWQLQTTPMTRTIVDPAIIGMPDVRGPYLAWQGEVTGPAVRRLALVDATRGTVRTIERMPGALDRIICDANNADAFAACTSAGAVRSEGDPATGIADVDLAYDFSGDWYAYFATLGRDSLDDAGMTLASTVRYCPAGEACPYQNAYWSGSQMTYGQGFASADDVVAHELTHGVTEKSANLFYAYQSGAINEAMSDIFGELVDLANGQGTDTPAVRWDMGEDLTTFGVIRDMEDPARFGDPDSTQSPLWYAGDGDYGGVHINSGVGNRAASLLADGGTHGGVTVAGIGTAATGRIFYRALVAGVTSGSNYTDLAAALGASCDALVGTHGITSGDCIQTRAAIRAVAMDVRPPEESRTAAACPAGITSTVVLADDMESPSAWNTSDAAVWSRATGYATSGVYALWGENSATASDTTATLTTPIAATRRTWLHLRHAYAFESGGDLHYDGGVIEYRTRTDGGAWSDWSDAGALIDGGDAYRGEITSESNALRGRQAFVGTSRGYGSTRISLAELAGSEVQVRLRIATDALVGDMGWLVDDLQVVTCPSADETPPVTSIVIAPDVNTTAPRPELRISEPATTECALDGGAFAPCTSPVDVGTLTEGTHTLRARSTDTAGNREIAPVAATFRVDVTPPDSVITRADAAAVEFTSEAGAQTTCRINGGAWEPCASPYVISGRLPAGVNLVMVRAQDAAGNIDPSPAEASITYAPPVAAPTPAPPSATPRVAPETRITALRTTRTQMTVRFSDPTRIARRFECRIDRGTWRACTSPRVYRTLRPGAHVVRVRGVSASGRRDATPAARAFRLRG